MHVRYTNVEIINSKNADVLNLKFKNDSFYSSLTENELKIEMIILFTRKSCYQTAKIQKDKNLRLITSVYI